MIQTEIDKPSRIAYKHLYLRYKALFFIAATLWLFTMGFLFSTARANIEMQRKVINPGGVAATIEVIR
jgi:hypothetical protein